jgi:hypothetical protein
MTAFGRTYRAPCKNSQLRPKNNGLKFKFCLLIRHAAIQYGNNMCRSANIATHSMQFKQSKDLNVAHDSQVNRTNGIESNISISSSTNAQQNCWGIRNQVFRIKKIKECL